MVGKWRILLVGTLLLTHPMPPVAQAKEQPSARDKAELKKMLRRHSYYGGGIPYGVRLATGDPNIPVIDRRTYGSMSSQCGFITARGKRTMLCQ